MNGMLVVETRSSAHVCRDQLRPIHYQQHGPHTKSVSDPDSAAMGFFIALLKINLDNNAPLDMMTAH